MQKNKLIEALKLYKSVTIPFPQIQEECNLLIDGISRKSQRKLLDAKGLLPIEITETVGIMLGLETTPPLQLAQIYIKKMKETLLESLIKTLDFGAWLRDLQVFIVSFDAFFISRYTLTANSDLESIYNIAFRKEISSAQRTELETDFIKLAFELQDEFINRVDLLYKV